MWPLKNDRYTRRLIEFYGKNPAGSFETWNPKFEQEQVRRVLWTARAAYFTKLFRWAARKAWDRVRFALVQRLNRVYVRLGWAVYAYEAERRGTERPKDTNEPG